MCPTITLKNKKRQAKTTCVPKTNSALHHRVRSWTLRTVIPHDFQKVAIWSKKNIIFCSGSIFFHVSHNNSVLLNKCTFYKNVTRRCLQFLSLFLLPLLPIYFGSVTTHAICCRFFSLSNELPSVCLGPWLPALNNYSQGHDVLRLRSNFSSENIMVKELFSA